MTRNELRRLRLETKGDGVALVKRETLALLLDAVEALDEIQAHAYRVIGYGIDVTVNRAPEREGCDQFVSGPTGLPGGDCDGDGHYMCRECVSWNGKREET